MRRPAVVDLKMRAVKSSPSDLRGQSQHARLVDLTLVHRPSRPDRVLESPSVRNVGRKSPEPTGRRQERRLGVGGRAHGVVEYQRTSSLVAVRRRKPAYTAGTFTYLFVDVNQWRIQGEAEGAPPPL